MLKINKSILIICIVSLFLMIGQISASNGDSLEIDDTIQNDLILDSSDSNMNTDESNKLEE
ncbi:MAG: hypothetical protein J6O99_08520, partial [Methanobrevibacter sp.]|nr:hypothetical protein [Methanobrevibacter sp.]